MRKAIQSAMIFIASVLLANSVHYENVYARQSDTNNSTRKVCRPWLPVSFFPFFFPKYSINTGQIKSKCEIKFGNPNMITLYLQLLILYKIN